MVSYDKMSKKAQKAIKRNEPLGRVLLVVQCHILMLKRMLRRIIEKLNIRRPIWIRLSYFFCP